MVVKPWLKNLANQGFAVVRPRPAPGDSAYKKLPEEFTARANYWTTAEVLHQATAESAEIIRMAGKLNREGLFGEIREGWNADLVLFDEDPLEDISVIETPERAIALVMQAGYLVRDNR